MAQITKQTLTSFVFLETRPRVESQSIQRPTENGENRRVNNAGNVLKDYNHF